MHRQKELSSKQQKFVDSYNGNATEAAIKAGYSKKTARSIGQENLTKPYILNAIRERGSEERAFIISTRQERQAFWTAVMNDEDTEIQYRLKASELLGRSEADFTDKLFIDKPLLIIKDLTGEETQSVH